VTSPCIQRRERLVQKQQPRLAHQRAGQCDALRLAARQRRRPRIQVALQPYFAQRRLGPLAGVAAGQAERDVAPHRLPRQQPRLLERDGDRVRQRDPRAGRGRIEARQRAQQRRLARAAAAEQRRERTRRQVEVERVEHRVVAETARQAAHGHTALHGLAVLRAKIGHGDGVHGDQLRSKVGRQASARRSSARTRPSANRPSSA
jgi:hypothetical protein